MGRRSTVAADFGTEWRVAGEAPGQSLVVMTPFHRLALAARNSAFKSEEMRPRDVESLVQDQEGRLVLWATVRGAKPDFARFYVPLLYRGEQEIKPSFTQNERTALREEDGSVHGAVHVRVSRRGARRQGAGHAGGQGLGERAGRAVQRRSLGHALAAGKGLDHGHSGAVRAGHDLPAVPGSDGHQQGDVHEVPGRDQDPARGQGGARQAGQEAQGDGDHRGLVRGRALQRARPRQAGRGQPEHRDCAYSCATRTRT